MIKKVEVLANIAVIVTSIVLCSVLVKKYFFISKQPVAAAVTSPASQNSINPKGTSALQSGTKVSLPGVDWGKSKRNLVLALSTTCHFCTESAPFYQQLEQLKSSDVRLLAVLPQTSEEAKLYLSKLRVNLSDVAEAPLQSIGVGPTPTLILIDNNGIVKRSWVGKLRDDETASVLTALK